MSEEILEGEIIDHVGDLVPVQRHGTGVSVVPEVTANDLVQRLAVIRSAMKDAMEKDIDYGVIPGTGSKPTLLKPGSEKLAVLFQLDIQLDNEKIWDGAHLTVMSKAIVYHAPTGTRLGMGEGICSTKESKYAYRNAERVCPECNEPQVRKGKARDGKPGNWYCWKKFNGCGQTWALDSPQGKLFDGMETGRAPNPDLPDLWNTATKMAEKRARISAVLAVTGASALFTQDVNDDDPGETQQREAKPEVRTDDKRPMQPARSWADWDRLMLSMEVPTPREWLELASEAAGVESSAWGGDLSVRANRVLLHLADNPPASSLGFWSTEEVQGAFAMAFSGVMVNATTGASAE